MRKLNRWAFVVLMNFNENPPFYKPYFDRRIDDLYLGSNGYRGIKMRYIFWVKTDTPVGDQSPNGPWEIGAMNSIPSYGQTQPVRAERVFRPWRNGFSPIIFLTKGKRNMPGGRDSLLFNMKPSYWSEIFSDPYSDWKCFDHGYLFKKQIKPHLRNIDYYSVPLPFG